MWSLACKKKWKSGWIKAEKMQKVKRKRFMAKLVVTIIILGLWATLAIFVCLQYLLVDPSSKK